jgi:hypothetical protein
MRSCDPSLALLNKLYSVVIFHRRNANLSKWETLLSSNFLTQYSIIFAKTLLIQKLLKFSINFVVSDNDFAIGWRRHTS